MKVDLIRFDSIWFDLIWFDLIWFRDYLPHISNKSYSDIEFVCFHRNSLACLLEDDCFFVDWFVNDWLWIVSWSRTNFRNRSLKTKNCVAYDTSSFCKGMQSGILAPVRFLEDNSCRPTYIVPAVLLGIDQENQSQDLYKCINAQVFMHPK